MLTRLISRVSTSSFSESKHKVQTHDERQNRQPKIDFSLLQILFKRFFLADNKINVS